METAVQIKLTPTEYQRLVRLLQYIEDYSVDYEVEFPECEMEYEARYLVDVLLSQQPKDIDYIKEEALKAVSSGKSPVA